MTEDDDEYAQWFYCGCHGIVFSINDGICPSCNDEWEELTPDDPRIPHAA